MATEPDITTLDEVLTLAQRLTVIDKMNLIERLLPDIKSSLNISPTQEKLLESTMKGSEPAFARVWDNEEDAVYDKL